MLFLQPPTLDDSGRTLTSTVCTEFPPDGGANVVNTQQCPSAAASKHPFTECSVAAAVSPPTCPANINTCHQDQQQCHIIIDSSHGARSGLPCSEQSIEETGDQGSSETARVVPQGAPSIPCCVVQRRAFHVASLSGGANHAVCPIRPKMDVCMLVCIM